MRRPAVGAIYAPPDRVGKRVARMIADLSNGKAFKSIVPEYPPMDTVFDRDVAKKLGVVIPKKYEK